MAGPGPVIRENRFKGARDAIGQGALGRTTTALLKRIIARAIELVEQKFPKARGLIEKPSSKDARHDLLRRKPTKAVIAYVKKNFPNAEQEMGPDTSCPSYHGAWGPNKPPPKADLVGRGLSPPRRCYD